MKLKKLFSIFLVLTMVISLCPAAIAAPPGGGIPEGGLPEGGLPDGEMPDAELPDAEAGAPDAEPSGLDLAANLASGAYKWEKSEDGSYYVLAYVTYVEKPVFAEATKAKDLLYQQITIFVPAAYVHGVKEDGNLAFDYSAKVANGDGDEVYTVFDAPIYFACESPGYSENACSESLGGMSDNSAYLKDGMIVVNVGHRGKGSSIQTDGKTVYTGKAPWALVDVKAAIQFLRLNDAYIPGSSERIISSASSGGGALSGMIAATGDYEAYLPYLYEIGAAGVEKNADGSYSQKYSNAVYASNLWCPILNVDYSDAAYEAFYGLGGRGGNDNSFQIALNGALAESFGDYIAAFGFEGIDSYEDFINGPFCDAVTASANEQLYSMVNGFAAVVWLEDDDKTPCLSALSEEEMAAKFIAGHCEITSAGMGGMMNTSNAAPIGWLAYEDGALVITDMEACCEDLATAGNKSITGFDGIVAVMTENQPFGDRDNNYKHYSAAYLEVIQGNAALEAAFNGYDYKYSISSQSEAVPEDLAEGAEKRLTTTSYDVTVDEDGNITVDKTVKVEDVKAASGGMGGFPGGPGGPGPGGSRNEVVAAVSNERIEGYYVSGLKEDTEDEILSAGVVLGQTAGQYASGMESYAAWVADFKAEVDSQTDEYGNNVVDLYNPMNFILGTDKGGSGSVEAYNTAAMAQHWRVRHGTTDANSAPVIATLLNEALEIALAEGKIASLDFLLPWEGPHGVVEAASDDLSAWIADVWVSDELTAEEIEYALDLDNMDQQWTFTDGGWVLSSVCAVARPEQPDYEGVSVCVPGAYVKGIDTDGDGVADVSAENAQGAVAGSLVIDYEAKVTSSNGQVYTAATAPLVLNTGAMGYSSQSNQNAGTKYVSEGYINISCGNRGKQSVVSGIDGEVLYYTGDAPSCLVDQKAAARFVKYNILLGNLPGNVDYLVSTGGSGGAAHASMFAATSNNPAFYDYQIEVGAVGVYDKGDGSYSTAVTIDGISYEINDGAWGSIAYSTISSLYEADMSQAFEYYMDTTFEFNSEFEKQLAEYLSHDYMEYINAKELEVDGLELSIEYDPEKYPDTNGFGGTYLDYYLAEFTENLQWYVDNLDYAEGWTWFDEDGKAVESLDGFDKVSAFIEGRYVKASTGGMGGPGMGAPPGMMPGMGPGSGNGFAPGGMGMGGAGIEYADFDQLAEAWINDVAEVYEGDRFGNNQVHMYDPLNFIGAEGTSDPTWAKIIMGAKEGDIAMMNSMNMEIAWLNAGTDMILEWQWDGGHVPSEVLGDSFSLTLDQMYAKHVADAENKNIEKPAAKPQANGSETEASGDDHSAWISIDENGKVSFTLADVLAYRNAGANKSVPGFDVENGGQENYVFGSADVDTRHWDIYVANIFADPEKAAVLEPLYNATKGNPYDDLGEGDWYYDDVIYAFCHDLMNGTGDARFDPNGIATRAMVVTVLYRIAGEPAVSGTNGFTDLSADWYAEAVQWAVNEGITTGKSESCFDPNAPVTREELAVFLYRYAKAQPVEAELGGYSDAEDISPWAIEAMQWANAKGLITGVSDTLLEPSGVSSRAVLATLLARFDRLDS